ncbi:MAG: hypothetical protein ACJAT2_002567 [Bacteriovoracaceae bacterium]|jgi:uncharacterized protein YdiU (UPF0061 family)
MNVIEFENTYSKLGPQFFEEVLFPKFENPELLQFNSELAMDLGIDIKGTSEKELALIFSGQKIIEGSMPLAMAYAGHQFAHFVPQLGDGRAALLGETKGFDIQLKGAGQTYFSRRGDGRSALGPVIREYLVSEAMHQLRVPTTRALAAVITNERVQRHYPEPGGIFTRVAESHLRVGTFQFFAAREDTESLKTLVSYACARHYPKAKTPLEFLLAVAKKQAELVAHWMGLGFIHGVMNTDNSSIGGITIDYGPCAFMDEFNFQKKFSSIDQNGRYAYINQGPMTQWNILRLSECLIPLIDEDPNKAIKIIQESLEFLPNFIKDKITQRMSAKLGLRAPNEKLCNKFLTYLQENQLDFTLGFRNLHLLKDESQDFYPKTKLLEEFLPEWLEQGSTDGLDLINPLYIPRNHQIQRIIEDVYQGEYQSFKDFLEVLKNPFEKNERLHHFHLPPLEDEKVTETFCGT